MHRSNLYLLAAVGAGLVVMTVWRLFATEIEVAPTPPDGGRGAEAVTSPASHGEEVAVRPVAGAPRVVVAVTARETYTPPFAGRVVAVELPDRTPLPTTMVAGTGANPWGDATEAGRAGVALVAIAIDGGRIIRQAGLEAAATTEVGVGGTLAVRGTVRGTNGLPLRGARVWFGGLDAAGAPQEIVTEADGVFEARVRGGAGVPFAVRAEGHASQWRPITVDVDTVRELEIRLLAGCTVGVQLTGRADEPERARAFVTPTATRSSELSQYPFFWQALFGGAAIGADGRAEIAGLPQRGEVGVAVVHPCMPLGPTTEVRLDGSRATCTVRVMTGPAFHGSIIDDAGEAVVGATLLLRPGGRAVQAGGGLLLQPPQLAARGCLFAATAADGTFVLGEAGEQGTVLSLRAPGHAGRDVPWPGTAAPTAQSDQLMLPVWRGGDLVLRVLPPCTGTAWRAEIGVGEGVELDCAADRPAEVALPHAGAFDLHVATYVGDELRGERTFAGVAATGLVVLPSPKIE